jgi:hypothetical protein
MEALFQGIYRDGNTITRTSVAGVVWIFTLPVITQTAIPPGKPDLAPKTDDFRIVHHTSES